MRLTISSILSCFAIAYCGCSSVGRKIGTEPKKITFEGIPGDTAVIVPVQIDGETVRLILDTGAGIDIISTKVAQRHGVKLTAKQTGHRLNGDPMTIEMGKVRSISFAGINHTESMVGPLAYFDTLSKQMNIQGLLSLKFFENIPFTIDYPNKLVILETADSLSKRRAAGVRASLVLSEEFPGALDAQLEILIDGRYPLRAIIDSGSAPTHIPLEYLKKMGLSEQDSKLKVKTFATIAGTKAEAKFLAAPGRVAIAGTNIKNDDSPLRFEQGLKKGSIGGQFLSGYAVTFNLPDKEIILQHMEPEARK